MFIRKKFFLLLLLFLRSRSEDYIISDKYAVEDRSPLLLVQINTSQEITLHLETFTYAWQTILLLHNLR